MAATTHSQALAQLNIVRSVFDRFVIPHDGDNTVPTSNFIYLGIEYCLVKQACRIPSTKVHTVLSLLNCFIFGTLNSVISKHATGISTG